MNPLPELQSSVWPLTAADYETILAPTNVQLRTNITTGQHRRFFFYILNVRQLSFVHTRLYQCTWTNTRYQSILSITIHPLQCETFNRNNSVRDVPIIALYRWLRIPDVQKLHINSFKRIFHVELNFRYVPADIQADIVCAFFVSHVYYSIVSVASCVRCQVKVTYAS